MRKLWIDGRFTDGSTGASLEIVDPATEEDVDRVPKGGPAEVERAVAAAKRAFPAWKRTPAMARAGLLANVRHGMSLLKEEIFGPVAAILPFGTFDEALALANDSPYGLGATLFSRDARRVRRYFEEIEVGNVWVNDPLVDNPAGPFGGMKMSGLGRELGEEGLEEFQQTKHVHWDIEGPIKPWWFPLEK